MVLCGINCYTIYIGWGCGFKEVKMDKYYIILGIVVVYSLLWIWFYAKHGDYKNGDNEKDNGKEDTIGKCIAGELRKLFGKWKKKKDKDK